MFNTIIATALTAASSSKADIADCSTFFWAGLVLIKNYNDNMKSKINIKLNFFFSNLILQYFVIFASSDFFFTYFDLLNFSYIK